MSLRVFSILMMAFGMGYGGGLPVMGSPADTNEVKLAWGVPTNHWPSSVWSYRVIPHNFAPPVISNLIALGSFTESDRAKPYKRPAFKDPGLLIFRKEDPARELVISPYLGWIEYRDEAARAKGTEHPKNVPTEQQAFQSALDLLRALGIDRSQLATKGDTTELRTFRDARRKSWFDKDQNKQVEEITSRGVYFVRRVDGIDFEGIGPRGGVYITFGDNGRVTDLGIVWRNIEPYKLHPTLSSEEMLDAIRSGKAKWQSPLLAPGNVKTVTVKEVMVFYRGADGETEQRTIEPFAVLATSVGYGFTNVVASLECPIIK